MRESKIFILDFNNGFWEVLNMEEMYIQSMENWLIEHNVNMEQIWFERTASEKSHHGGTIW